MGNYKDFDVEFVNRTLLLIEQYEGLWREYEFNEQLNYTLLINCLLGLIVFPKERVFSFLPIINLREADKRKELGLYESIISDDIDNLRDLIGNMRHSVAHGDIEITSNDESFLINEIHFMNKGHQIASFQSKELLPFLTYYCHYLVDNLKKYRR